MTRPGLVRPVWFNQLGIPPKIVVQLGNVAEATESTSQASAANEVGDGVLTAYVFAHPYSRSTTSDAKHIQPRVVILTAMILSLLNCGKKAPLRRSGQ